MLVGLGVSKCGCVLENLEFLVHKTREYAQHDGRLLSKLRGSGEIARALDLHRCSYLDFWFLDNHNQVHLRRNKQAIVDGGCAIFANNDNRASMSNKLS
jgi:hypothetical protein